MLFWETKDAANTIFIALLVSKLPLVYNFLRRMQWGSPSFLINITILQILPNV